MNKLILVDKEDEDLLEYKIYIHKRDKTPRIYMDNKLINLKSIIAERMGLKGYIKNTDGNPLNCQRGNLNNEKAKRKDKKKYEGISYNKKNNKYEVRIKYKEKITLLGYFKSLEKATIAYNNKLSELLLVDEEDKDLLEFDLWIPRNKKVYINTNGRQRQLSRLVGERIGIRNFITHKDGNFLNCKRDNLKSIFEIKNKIVVDKEDQDLLLLPISFITKYKQLRVSFEGRKRILNRLIGERIGIKGTVIHKDGNYLNCKRENLQKRSKRKEPTGLPKSGSGYFGVSYDKIHNVYQARLTYNKQKYYLGNFKTAKEAAIAYNNKVKQLKPKPKSFKFNHNL